MLLHFRSARVLDKGNYEISELGGGTVKYPWVELIQPREDVPDGWPGRDSTGSQRFSVEIRYDSKGLQVGGAPSFDGVPFGTLIDGYAEVSDKTKVIKGTDRSVDQIKFSIIEWRPSAVAAAPKVEKAG
jgi:hypothetical protein